MMREKEREWWGKKRENDERKRERMMKEKEREWWEKKRENDERKRERMMREKEDEDDKDWKRIEEEKE